MISSRFTKFSESKAIASFETIESIEQCADLQKLIDTLILKLNIMVKVSLDKLSDAAMLYARKKHYGTLYTIGSNEYIKYCESAEETADNVKSKYELMVATLEAIRNQGNFSEEQEKLLKEFKAIFTGRGPKGARSRTEVMFDRLLTLGKETKYSPKSNSNNTNNS